MTALSDLGSMRNFDREFAGNARLRGTGTDILLSASRAAGVRRFVAQCWAGFLFAGDPRRRVAETEPLASPPPKPFRNALAADRHLEAAVTGAT